jgi:Tol biopolymer transport system component
MKRWIEIGLLVIVATYGTVDTAAAQAVVVTERASVDNSGAPMEAGNTSPTASADGRYVAFLSQDTSQDGCHGVQSSVPGGGLSHVYVRDRQAGRTECVSRASDGTEANATNNNAMISGDGRYVVFTSSATNLGAPPGAPQIFVRDRVALTTTMVSVAPDGVTAANATVNLELTRISANGQFVAFTSKATNLVTGGTTAGRQHVYVRDVTGGVTVLLSVAPDGTSEGNGDSFRPSMTPDGRYIVFSSAATNLQTTVDGNGSTSDLFLRDRVGGTTELVSKATDGTAGNDASFNSAISPDGKRVMFASLATNFATGDATRMLFARDRVAQTTTGFVVLPASDVPNARYPAHLSISGDGRLVAFDASADPGFGNGTPTYFLHDRALGATVRVGVPSGTAFVGPNGGPMVISADGRFLVFDTNASLLSPTAGGQVYVASVKRYSVDVSVYRSTTGVWYLQRAFDGSTRVDGWGSPANGDIPVYADYDGDGRSDIAVYRPTSGDWFIAFSSGSSKAMTWGSPSLQDSPVPADYDGDGKADVAVYRKTNGTWIIALSGGGLRVLSWGAPSLDDVPVPADYDGDHKADIAVYRRSTGVWYVVLSSGGSMTTGWGAPSLGDQPVPGDYDGDGVANIAVYRASTGEWFILTPGGGLSTVSVGGAAVSGDMPIPADYDADGKTDVAIYRTTTSEWFILQSSGSLRTLTWGANAYGDIPVTLATGLR